MNVCQKFGSLTSKIKFIIYTLKKDLKEVFTNPFIYSGDYTFDVFSTGFIIRK